ncbi:MAG: AAA family ATPase [Chloroflexales bacterium]|nr:AAA family ATPase [Chloroflexales bacterium]
MRPLTLTMRAFGPYGGEQHLDFAELGDHTSFLIHGPTGAGKSTVLDAIAYALYGKSSGGGRSDQDMRSKHAAPGTATEVVFTFSIGAERYRVTRRPSYLRPPHRGRGKLVPEGPFAELERLSPDGAAETIEEGADAVSDEAGRLLGLSYEQFQQVAVLAQGRFLEFLEANPTKRKEVLSTLFGAERYEQIEQRLAAEAKDLAARVKHQEERRGGLLASLGLEQVSTLGDHRLDVEVRFSAAVALVSARASARDEARAALTAGERAQELVSQDQAARAALAAVEARGADILGKRQRAQVGERAAALADVMRSAETRRQERDARCRAASQAQAELETTEAALTAAEEALLHEEGRAQERAEATARAVEAARFVGLATEAATLRERLAGLRADMNLLVSQQEDAAQRHEALRQHQPRLEAAAHEAELAAAQREGLRLRVEQLRARLTRIEQLQGLIAEHTAAEGQALTTQERVEETEWLAAEQKRDAHELEQRWVAGQAGRLAAALAPDEPCPVCGSTEHPQPAHIGADIVNDEALGEARQAAEVARQAHDDARGVLITAVARRDELAYRVAKEREALGADEDAATLAQAIKAEEQTRAQAEAIAEELSARQGTLQRLRDELAMIEREIAERGPQLQTQRSALTEVSALLEDREQRVPTALGTAEQAQQAADAARVTAEILEATYTQARIAADAASGRSDTARAILAERRATSEAAELAAAALEQDIASRLAVAGFPDEAAYAAAHVEPNELATLRSTVAAYDEELALARARVEQAALVARDIVAPDMAALQGALRESDEQLAERQSEAAKLERERQQIDEVAQQIEELNSTLQADEERHRIVGHLAHMAGGKNEQKLSFHQYMLARTFDEVLESASRRLRSMSDGRYTIQREVSPGERRRSSGLDIVVDDFYTSSQRRTQTLSGGEGFLASLALALGLADIVQAESGGVYLETLFVDEGFGTLDPDTLDDCLETLLDLQTGGRLIGIISHVAALQSRIPAHLEVRRGPGGSEARFIIRR